MARLNEREFRVMQSSIRRAAQRLWELPTFVRMLDRAGIDLAGRRILDAGCGSGYGTLLLRRRFRPSRLVGLDLMPEQIERARALGVPGAEFRVGDLLAIDAPDASFDAAFVFGVLHHVPGWRDALREIARVIAPGGALLAEEIEGRAVDLEDRLLGMSHPREARFGWPAFRDALRAAGLAVQDERALAPFGAARSFLARRR